jgi:hypothetical protein
MHPWTSTQAASRRLAASSKTARECHVEIWINCDLIAARTSGCGGRNHEVLGHIAPNA